VAELIRERYEPVEVVGRGGQGEVLRAIDTLHDRLVALKVRETGSAEEQQGLLLEAGILLAIRPHPNLPLVREDFIIGGHSYVVMDWIEGRNLSRVLAEDGSPGLALDRVIDYVGQAAGALDHLHDHDPPVVHRDVKPANLILRPDGSVVLVDFGISQRWGKPDRATGSSPGYGAPELATGPATPASDVFSLAATAYTLLTGNRPRPEVRPHLSGIPENVAEGVLRALRRALAADPARRPPSATALAESLRAAAAGIPQQSRPRVWAAAAVGAAILAGGAVFAVARGPAGIDAAVVGNNPAGVVANPQGNRVYVANFGSRSVSVIDGTSKRVLATVPVGARPEAIAVNPRTGNVYVANGDATVSVIDGELNAVADTIRVGSKPEGIAANPRNNRIYVATTRSGVAIIDGAKNRVDRSVGLPSTLRGIAVSPDAHRVYVTGEAPNTVSVINADTDEIIGTVAVPERPCGIAVSHRENLVYVAGRDSGTVFVIDGDVRVIRKKIPVGAKPCGLAVNAKAMKVYVGHDSGVLTVIDAVANRVAATRRVVESAHAATLLLNQVAVDPQTRRVYVVDRDSNRVLILSEKDL
jgi:YVTN family beta-propeller protein